MTLDTAWITILKLNNMHIVNFNDESTRTTIKRPHQSSIIGVLIRKGVVKNTTQANILLVAIVLLCVGALWFLYTQNKGVPEPTLTPTEIENAGASSDFYNE